MNIKPLADRVLIKPAPAEEKTGLKGYCVQQAAIPAFAEPVFMTISRKRSKMRKNLQ